MANGIVLDLQKEILKSDCDILMALRQAHLIAYKLNLEQFDNWVLNELNGYKENIPDYRVVRGQLRAYNPYHGWVDVLIGDIRMENLICRRTLDNSMSELIHLSESEPDYLELKLPSEAAILLSKVSTLPITLPHSLFISKHSVLTIIEKVKNCLLEWTMTLEKQGIIGEGMSFNKKETESAKGVPQQITNYYGNTNVINGNFQESQIISANEVDFDYENAEKVIHEVLDYLKTLEINHDDKKEAIELAEETEAKIKSKKKRGIIKSSFTAIKDFLIGLGSGVAVAFIEAKMNGLF